MFWTCCVMWLLYVTFLMESTLASDTPFPDFYLAVGLVLIATRFNWSWHDAPPGVPHSEWRRGRCFLQMAAAVLTAVCALLWAWQAARALLWSEDTVAAAWDPRPYLAALWVAWASLALGPAICLGLLVLSLWQYYTQQIPAEPTLFAACLAWLLLPALLRRGTPSHVADVFIQLVVLVLIVAGYVLIERLATPPEVRWTLREILGSLLVLALVRHHVRLGTASPATARRIRRGLLAGVVASWIAVVMWGPFDEPDAGIMALILALGWVPPLFLPLLMIPHYFAWMRWGSDRAKVARRKMPWMT